jgi:hypothetical protein
MKSLYYLLGLIVSLLTNRSFATYSAVPLTGGSEFYKNLRHGEIVCRMISVPVSAVRVRLTASVVGLTGNPNIFGGWDQQSVLASVQSNLAPPNSGGYHVLSETLDIPSGGASSYYICVTTFSTQGSDFLLTAAAQDVSGWLPMEVGLIDGYPVVWRLEGEGVNYVDFKLPLDTSAHNLTVSLIPLSGEVDLRVSECSSWSSALGVSADIGPDFLSIAIPPEYDSICLRVHSDIYSDSVSAEFSLVATRNLLGPFMAQSLPVVGKGAPFQARAYFNADTDMTVSARVVGSDTTLSDKLFIDAGTSPGEIAWKTSPGSSNLEISKTALKDRNSDIIYFSVTNDNSELLSLTSTTFGSVETLEDGIPVSVTVSDSNFRFRDFRVWFPRDASLLTIQGDSSEDGSGLGLFASTTRTSHDPRGYTWNTMASTNEIFLTSDAKYLTDAKSNFHLVPCTNCYVYISVKSCVVENGKCSERGVSKYVLTASTDKTVVELFEGRSLVVPVNGLARFMYKARNGTESVTFFMSGSSMQLAVTADKDMISDDLKWTEACDGTTSRCSIESKLDGESFLWVKNEASDVGFIEIVAKHPNAPQLLRNHHPVSGSVLGEEFFTFAVPSSAENGMIELKGDSSVTVCFPGGGCTEVTGDGTVHFPEKFNGGVIGIRAKNNLEKRTVFQITPSFFSASNSLRIGYKPITVAVDAGKKISWQVGYYDRAEWVISATGTNGVELCVDDQGSLRDTVRCCSLPCSLQGFDRQIVWLENKNGPSKVTVTLSTENLPILRVDESVDISDRLSKNLFWFKIPPVSRIVNADVAEYRSGSLEGSVVEPVSLPSNTVLFAKIASGSSPILQTRHTLQPNVWSEHQAWTRISQPGNVRVERCDGKDDPTDLVVNGGGMKVNVMDITFAESSDIEISGKDDFRVVTSTSQSVDVLFDPDSSFLGFLAPSNAESTLYRALCTSPGHSPKQTPSQCFIEHSVNTVRGEGVACIGGLFCEVKLPETCGAFATVVADKGVQYGMFEPVSLDWSATSANVESEGWSWRRIVFWAIVLYFGYRLVIANKILLRMVIFRGLNYMRNKTSKDQLLQQELGHMEAGYKRMGDFVPPKDRQCEMHSRSVRSYL